MEVTRPKIIETTSLGAAFLAGLNADLFENFSALQKSKLVERTFLPRERENRYVDWKEAVKKVLT